MPESPVVIVGAGPAGLTTAAALKVEGIDAVLLDQAEEVAASWSRRYRNLTLHTVRRFSSLAHYPMPRSYPKYVSRDLFVAYLRQYVDHFDLPIELGCRVHRVQRGALPTPIRGREVSGPGFRIQTSGGVWYSPVVVLATGHNGMPVRPSWPGQDTYGGRLIHSVEYDVPAKFEGRRVLVVGAGNSGTEIAADLGRHGAQHVAISVRTPPPIVPRDFLGTPVQVFGILLSPLPPRLADRIGSTLTRIALGDLTQYGLDEPAWQPFTARRIPTIDTGFVEQVKRGRIQVRTAVAELRPDSVQYADGDEEPFDDVIMATGFSTGLKRFLAIEGLLREDGFPQEPGGEETGQPGLYFMGYTESHRGHLFEARRDSLRLAPRIRRYLQ